MAAILDGNEDLDILGFYKGMTVILMEPLVSLEEGKPFRLLTT